MSALSGRVDTAALPLAVVDLVAILGVLTIGMIQHSTFSPARAAGVYGPFLIGWAAAAVLIGAYSAGAAESAKAAIPLAVRAWVPAAAVGFALRASPLFSGGFQLIFGVVVFVAGGVALVALRWLFFKLRG